jgi:hypothetical protein
MGSSRRRNSTGRKATAARPSTSKSLTRLKAAAPHIDTVLERLSASLSIIATATSALLRAQEQERSLTPQDIDDPVTTLEHGVKAMRGALDELDVAYREIEL